MEDIESKTVNQLKQYCREKHIKGFSQKRKQELIDFINDYHKQENINGDEEEDGGVEDVGVEDVGVEEDVKEDKITDENKKLNAISLFSGMGGDSLGIVNSGFNLIAYSEKEKVFQETHDLNFKNSKLLGDGDITKTKDEDLLKYKDNVNLIFAGFPCQGFSNGGKKMKNDPRNTLFKEFVRATKLINPKYIIGENVKGLLSRKTSDNENYIDVIVKEFEDLGFVVYYKVMKTYLYGIPQKRERLIIVGIKKELNKPFEFPEEISTDVNLKNIVKFDMKGSIKIEKDDFDMTTIPEECILKDMNNEEDENTPHPNLKLLAKDKDYVYNEKTYPRRLSFAKRDSSIHGEIIDIRYPAKTIICTYARQPRLFVPLQNKKGYYLRCFLPDELKQIQGFPADYKIMGNDTNKIIQIGNAVPPPLIEQIIYSIIN